LEGLRALELDDDNPELARARKELQARVRKQGQKIVSAALGLMSREKESLALTLARSRQILIYSLVLLLLILLVNAYLLGSRILRSIKRYGEYAKRIATGDFTPITPTRGYRDEFTDLALAINSMMEEQKKREAIMIQSHKMRAVGTLTAGVAHELNNPLNNITLTAYMLQEDYDDLSDDERREMVDDVVKEAGRAKKIISNLLDFARETGSQLEPLDLPQLLQETVALASNQLKLSGVKIGLQATDNLPRVHGDPQQLQQVFLNLILNAIDASPKGGKIQVLVAPADEPNCLAVKVIDYGTGIPEHILPTIFDPFFTTKARGRGTGLGLSVSQGIVAKHGGRILVSSREGQGAAFTVVLPITTIPAKLDQAGG
jgi:signal transduction histidine kinase